MTVHTITTCDLCDQTMPTHITYPPEFREPDIGITFTATWNDGNTDAVDVCLGCLRSLQHALYQRTRKASA